MNIVTTNCLGGHIYRDLLRTKYGNPFVWTNIWNKDFIELIKYWDEINLENYQLLHVANGSKTLKLLIDSRVNVEYNHYIFSKIHNIPTKIGIDIYYDKIWEYLIEKYEKRLSSMSKHIDLIAVDDFGGYDIKEIYEICKDKMIKCFICTDKLPEESSNTVIIRPRFRVEDHGPGPGDIPIKYGKEIKTLLGIR